MILDFISECKCGNATNESKYFVRNISFSCKNKLHKYAVKCAEHQLLEDFVVVALRKTHQN